MVGQIPRRNFSHTIFRAKILEKPHGFENEFSYLYIHTRIGGANRRAFPHAINQLQRVPRKWHSYVTTGYCLVGTP